MKVIVPMAGRGARFAGHGPDLPKPLLPVAGRPMVAWALRSLEGLEPSEVVFVALREHEERHRITALLRGLVPRSRVLLLDGVTEGQLCTVLAARDHLRSHEDVLVASADTLVVSDLAGDIARMPPETKGLISVADMPGDRWSFARTDESGRVVEVAEKVRISDHASTGLYWFSDGRTLLELGDAMVRAGERTRGEFYVIPLYRKYIERGWRVGLSAAKDMLDMGTPEALSAFEADVRAGRVPTGPRKRGVSHETGTRSMP